MDRLTDRKTAAALKKNADGLREKGVEPNMSDLRYINLADYENIEELIKTATNAPVLSYQAAVIKQLIDGKAVKCKVEITDKPTKTIDKPSVNVDGKFINDMIMRRFMERR